MVVRFWVPVCCSSWERVRKWISLIPGLYCRDIRQYLCRTWPNVLNYYNGDNRIEMVRQYDKMKSTLFALVPHMPETQTIPFQKGKKVHWTCMRVRQKCLFCLVSYENVVTIIWTDTTPTYILCHIIISNINTIIIFIYVFVVDIFAYGQIHNIIL